MDIKLRSFGRWLLMSRVNAPYCSHNFPHEATLNHTEHLTPSMSYDDEIKFRVGAEKEAAKLLDSLRVGGLNISQLAREGFEEKLREAVSDEDKIRIFEMYEDGEIEKDVARVILGDDLERMEDDIREFEEATERDTSGYLAE